MNNKNKYYLGFAGIWGTLIMCTIALIVFTNIFAVIIGYAALEITATYSVLYLKEHLIGDKFLIYEENK